MNASAPMKVTPSGMTMEARRVQLSNSLRLMAVMPLPKWAYSSLLQPRKMLLPREVTLLGMSMPVRLAQPMKAAALMLSTVLGMVTVLILVYAKEPWSSVCRPSGNVTDARLLQ